MAKNKQLTPPDIMEAIQSLSLEDMLAIHLELKMHIDQEQSQLTAKLNAIKETKDKLNENDGNAHI